MSDPKIILITGDRQIGKSTACLHTVPLLRQAGLRVSGLATRRTAPHDLEVTELHTGRSYPLTLPFDPNADTLLKQFVMDEAAFATSLAALNSAFPTDVLIIDEIGPLELRHRQGWSKVLAMLRRKSYTVAFIVVRPELLIEAICKLPLTIYTVVRVTLENRDELPAHLCRAAVKLCVSEEEE